MLATAQESVGYMRTLWDRMETESRDIVIAAGVKTNEVNRNAFHRIARPVVDSYVRNSGLEQLYAAIRSLA